MAWIRTIDDSSADERLSSAYRGTKDPETGNVDNILRAHSLHPEGLEGHVALYRAVMRGTPGLPEVDREMLALVVSGINRCHY